MPDLTRNASRQCSTSDRQCSGPPRRTVPSWHRAEQRRILDGADQQQQSWLHQDQAPRQNWMLTLQNKIDAPPKSGNGCCINVDASRWPYETGKLHDALQGTTAKAERTRQEVNSTAVLSCL